MNRNDFMKTTIVLVVGVLLIAGVVTPIIASVIAPEGSEDSGPSFVNTNGIPMTKLSDYIASHDLSSGNSYSITWSNSDLEWMYAIENGVSSKVENPLRGVVSNYYSMPFVSNVAMMFCDYDGTDNQYSTITLKYVPDSGTGVSGAGLTNSTSYPQSFSITIQQGELVIDYAISSNTGTRTFSFSDIDMDTAFIYHAEGDWRMVGLADSGEYSQKIKWIGDDMYTIAQGIYLGANATSAWIYSHPYPESFADTIHPNTNVDASQVELEYAVYDNSENQYELTTFDVVDGVTEFDFGDQIFVEYNVTVGSSTTYGNPYFLVPASSSSDEGEGGEDIDPLVPLLSAIPLILMVGLVIVTVRAYIRRA